MKQYIFDLEGNGLTPTKIHVLSVNFGGKIKSTKDYDKMRSMFSKADVLIGHNIARWDIPVVERLLGIKVKAKMHARLKIIFFISCVFLLFYILMCYSYFY